MAAWFDGITVTIEAAFGSDALAASPSWTDITQYVRDGSCTRGKADRRSSASAGSLTLTLANTDRRFDPSHTSGAYFPNVRLNTRVRVSVTFSSVTYRVWTGWVTAWNQRYTLGGDATCELVATDALGFLGNVRVPSSEWLRLIQADDPEYLMVPSDDPESRIMVNLGSLAGNNEGLRFESKPDLSGNALDVPWDSWSGVPGGVVDLQDRVTLRVASTGTNLLNVNGTYREVWFTTNGVPTASQVNLWGSHSWDAANVTRSIALQYLSTGLVRIYRSPASSTVLGVTIEPDIIHCASIHRYDDPDNPSLNEFWDIYLDGVLIHRETITKSSWIIAAPLTTMGLIGDNFPGEIHAIIAQTVAPTPDQQKVRLAAAREAWLDDRTGARATRILDIANWPAGLRDIDANACRMTATATGGRDALSLLNEAATAEQSRLVALGDGTIRLEHRQADQDRVAAAVSATWTDANYEAFDLQYDDADVINTATVTTPAGVTATATDDTSITQLGLMPGDVSNLPSRYRFDAENLAKFLLNPEPKLRVSRITRKMRTDPAGVLAREIGDVIQVTRTPSTGSAVTRKYHVEQITHTFSPSDWATTFTLSAVTPTAETAAVWGTSVWDTGTWGF